MRRVEMLVGGRRALVDQDMVRKMTRKEQILASSRELQARIWQENDPVCLRLLNDALDANVSKIVRLNRTIRQNVYFFPKEPA